MVYDKLHVNDFLASQTLYKNWVLLEMKLIPLFSSTSPTHTLFFILIYMDDIIIIGSDVQAVNGLIAALH